MSSKYYFLCLYLYKFLLIATLFYWFAPNCFLYINITVKIKESSNNDNKQIYQIWLDLNQEKRQKERKDIVEKICYKFVMYWIVGRNLFSWFGLEVFMFATTKQASKSIHAIKVINWNDNPIKSNPYCMLVAWTK